MSIEKDLQVCPGTLKAGYNGYSPTALKNMFNGKKISHILSIPPPTTEEGAEEFMNNRERISISGVQEKVSMILDEDRVRLTKEGEQGTYILKPVPRDVKYPEDVPANEHLTMQIADQIFELKTAQNALIFFNDGTPAYITKRFDVKMDGTKWGKEDFSSLTGRSPETDGQYYKYDGKYSDLGEELKKYVSAFPIERERLFKSIVFNYLFSNGDAHLKNFSLMETVDSDYLLSPFYDLMNTRIHVSDTPLALKGGLFEEAHRSKHYINTGKPIGTDFIKLAELWKIKSSRAKGLFSPFVDKRESVEEIIEKSFLSERSKRAYKMNFYERQKLLRKL